MVVGDLMLDRHIWGVVSRISPEAPVPVVRQSRQTEAPGGAANVAANLAQLGLEVTAAGFIGDDHEGERIRELLEGVGVETRGLVQVAGRATITKTRIVGGHQQMLRVDVDDLNAIPAGVCASFQAGLEELVRERPHVVVLSDYAKGTLPPAVCRSVITHARDAGIPVFVDPKGEDYEKYADATALCPNLAELALATRTPARDCEQVLRAGEALRTRIGVERIVVTQGEEGMMLIARDGVRRFPTRRREVYDVAGAGDAVIAIIAGGVAATLDFDDVLRLANLGAGMVVGKVGAAAVSRSELLEELESPGLARLESKVCSRTQLGRRVSGWRSRGERIVFTNGCFDLLHAGHVVSLESARRLGDRLIVAVNSDRSIRALKGASRPLVQEADRARVIAALGSVDAAVVFDEDTPAALIRMVRPDVLVKGQDYREEDVVGATDVKSWGGEVVLLPLLDGRGTSSLVSQVRGTLGLPEAR